ncbi:MAG: nucleotidyl transferase AbiEii/AbiGii toxin family protein [Candidatus Daviesbacteria bacterium]|nr:nucleotidyl transferase AbiEii/AbiGii toxin family protein [Candidatus Daviesbacteria bacterium]
MIGDEEIQKLATRYQTSAGNVRREYFQYLFLFYFYQQPKAKDIFFKGGTALRIIYNSPRFSEDLDFSCGRIDYKEIENLIEDTLAQIEKENVKFNLKEAKQTTGGFLAIISFEVFEQPIDIKIEISLRKGEGKGEIMGVTNNDYVPPYNIITVTEEQLVAEKIEALLNRKKPRDFYDLYFILRSQMLSPKKKNILPKTLKALIESDINFEVELKQFLPKSQWMIIKDFKNNLKREIQRYI